MKPVANKITIWLYGYTVCKIIHVLRVKVSLSATAAEWVDTRQSWENHAADTQLWTEVRKGSANCEGVTWETPPCART